MDNSSLDSSSFLPTLKALLISTSEPLSVKDVQTLIKRRRQQLENQLQDAPSEDDAYPLQVALEALPNGPSAEIVEQWFRELAAAFVEEESEWELLEGAEGWSLSVVPKFSPWVRLLRNEDKPLKLSRAALETLALVAYWQPVTRAEMEAVRGVSVDGALNKLLDHGLVEVTGQADLPGRPKLWGTSEGFLKFAGITSIEELPSSDVLSRDQFNEYMQSIEAGEEASDATVGLAEEVDEGAEAEETEAVEEEH